MVFPNFGGLSPPRMFPSLEAADRHGRNLVLQLAELQSEGRLHHDLPAIGKGFHSHGENPQARWMVYGNGNP